MSKSWMVKAGVALWQVDQTRLLYSALALTNNKAKKDSVNLNMLTFFWFFLKSYLIFLKTLWLNYLNEIFYTFILFKIYAYFLNVNFTYVSCKKEKKLQTFLNKYNSCYQFFTVSYLRLKIYFIKYASVVTQLTTHHDVVSYQNRFSEIRNRDAGQSGKADSLLTLFNLLRIYLHSYDIATIGFKAFLFIINKRAACKWRFIHMQRNNNQTLC